MRNRTDSTARHRAAILAGLVPVLALAPGCGDREPALPSPGPVSGDPIELAYRLQSGETWRFDVEAIQQMGAGDEGGPRMTLSYLLELKVAAVAADGRATLDLEFVDVKMESDPPSPAAAGAGLDFTDVDITATLTRAGEIADIQVSAPAGRDPDMYRTIVTYALMPFRLADRPMRVNEPWETNNTMPTRLMGLAEPLDFRATTRSWIAGSEADAVRIQQVGTVALPKQTVSPPDDTIASGPIEVASDGTVTVDVVFDRQRGMVSQLTGRMRSKMDIVTGDDRIVVHASATTTMRLRTVVSARW